MNRVHTIFLLLFLAGCSTRDTDSKYLRWVGDSKFTPEVDDEGFKPCFSEYRVKQYFNFDKGLQYEGEKKEIYRHFQEHYVPVKSEQSGWVRIRFIVNCRGETGRFRVIESDEQYKEQTFDQTITNQLLMATKSLQGWKLLPDSEKPKDYYQYLVFKIHQGNIVEIMP